jgi:hypothetical protein
MLSHMQAQEFVALSDSIVQENERTFVRGGLGPIQQWTAPQPPIVESPKELGKSHPASAE